jgi:hypothetical protein
MSLRMFLILFLTQARFKDKERIVSKNDAFSDLRRRSFFWTSNTSGLAEAYNYL